MRGRAPRCRWQWTLCYLEYRSGRRDGRRRRTTAARAEWGALHTQDTRHGLINYQQEGHIILPFLGARSRQARYAQKNLHNPIHSIPQQ
jgi:hypothetical protein